jgi:thiamine pyrophosphokinase
MIVESREPVLLIGAGDVNPRDLHNASAFCTSVVAADGGANSAVAHGFLPDVVIGDMDSVSDATRSVLPANIFHHVYEQDSTDFDKALRNIKAPLVVGLGFLGKRLDHELAAMSVLAKMASTPCILIGQEDIVLACPHDITLELPVGTRLSLFPMAPISGKSTGLRWPIDGISFTPSGIIGTSNETTLNRVELQFDQPGMLLILPKSELTLLVSLWPEFF